MLRSELTFVHSEKKYKEEMKLKEIAGEGGGGFGGRRRNNQFCSLSGVTNHDSAACASWRTRAAAAQTELYLEVILIWKSERRVFFLPQIYDKVFSEPRK